ncbi:ATP-binding cassette domain-containing protein [Pedococcus sp. 5OH_020]|uniref:ATP-binding cassette domain-containing protein n=1 Tax=Pedococcus sp. 5OH_020 TaxID=2989814 RepID=UPI0022EA04D3|nr:ATP-binding cassette domain-containing protein [Pedococcus sp. 5OH_020]
MIESYQETARADSPPVSSRGLRLTGITKTYPGVVAVNNVSFECRPGEVHALVGENGSGKSTLIKVAAGLVPQDSGTVQVGAKTLSRSDPRYARRLGLMTAYQDTSLVHDLTVAENIEMSFHCLGQEAPRNIKKLLAEFDLPFSPKDLLVALGPGGRQMLEVVRAMIHRPHVLLVDEPTAVLDLASADQLETLISNIRGEGCAVVYVSHRLDEVRRLADRLTVIRDGVIQGTHERMDWDVETIVELMVGAPIDLEFPDRRPQTTGDPLLEVKELRGSTVGPISLHVGPGEVVGIAGAEGNGQRHLLRAIIGVDRKSGSVELNGKPVTGGPPGALRAGISFQSGDRVAESVFPAMSIGANGTMQLGTELGPLATIRPKRMIQKFGQAVRELGIVSASAYQPISALSGGNQQKVVLSRASMQRPELLIIDEPTQGVDAKARLDIYRLVADTAASGVGVLVNSSDSFELAGLCDRVYVMSEGAVIDELTGTFTEAEIVRRFVSTTGKREDVIEAASRPGRRIASALASPRVPVVVLLVLMLLLGAYATSKSPVFLQGFNLNNLFLSALPLLWVVIGQQFALLVGELDISIGASMTLSVVLASFVLASNGVGSSLLGVVVILLVALVVGLFNALVTQVFGVTPLVATIGTLGIVSGICVLLRPEPSGAIGSDLSAALSAGVGNVPYGFIVALLVAGGMDFWLFRTGGGLATRAVGLESKASERVGVRVKWVKMAGYVIAAVGAAIGGVFLAVQVGVGSNDVALSLSLPAFTACFLGGATLTGGRGTFIGAALGATFLTLIGNAAQLINLSYSWTQVMYGVILLVAVTVYSIAARRAVA